jgi:hypothetical protein
MRENLVQFRGRICKGCGYAPYSHDCYPAFPGGLLCKGDADDLLALFREEISKLKPLSPEEIEDLFRLEFGEVSHSTDALRYIVEAQLDAVKKELEGK